MIKQLILELHQVNKEDTRRFKELVCNSIEILQLDLRSFAHEFGCTVTTITRWMKGTAAPHPAMRPFVYSLLIEKLEEHEAARA